MAEVKVSYQCGCGYNTKSPVEAAKHADAKGHFMHVSGVVQPEERLTASTAKPTAVRTAAPQHPPSSIGGVDLSELRAKLRRG